jgi:hypothetical protein
MAKDTKAKIEALKIKKQQIAARLASLEARAKHDNRKRDTRRKIIVGAAVIAHAETDHAFAKKLKDIFDKAVTRDQDKALVDEWHKGLLL